MDLTKFGLIGIIIATLISVWGQIKFIFSYISSIIFVAVYLDNDAGRAVGYYCWEKGRRSPFGKRFFSGLQAFVKPLQRYIHVGFEVFGPEPVLLLINKVPVVARSTVSNTQDINSSWAQDKIVLYYVRGTLRIEEFLKDAFDAFNSFKRMGGNSGYKLDRFFIRHKSGAGSIHARNGFSVSNQQPVSISASSSSNSVDISCRLESGALKLLTWQKCDIGVGMASAHKSPFEFFFYPDDVYKEVRFIERWLQSKDWYQNKMILWRMGVLLSGIPGTGKTNLVRCIAQELDIPIFTFDIASMSNQEFRTAWEECLSYSPVIVLIEDIDRVFNKDVNILGDQGGGLCFSEVLNCLSGIYPCDGLLTFITTNDISKIDPALGIITDNNTSTRPGRLDRIITLKEMDYESRFKLASLILKDYPELIQETVAAGDGETAAQFQKRCADLALELFWGSNKEEGFLDNKRINGETKILERTYV